MSIPTENRISGSSQVDPSNLGITRGGKELSVRSVLDIHDSRERRRQAGNGKSTAFSQRAPFSRTGKGCFSCEEGFQSSKRQSGKPKCDGYKAFGKLILSGEHSVLYGGRALALSLNDFTTDTSISFNKNPHFSFCFSNLHCEKIISLTDLHHLKQTIDDRYAQFLFDGKIRDVLIEPSELLLYTFIYFLEEYNVKEIPFLTISIDSNIPIGVGMGSSAASIISLSRAINDFFDLKISDFDLVAKGREIENLQHGRSSGLDIYLAANGGFILWQNGKIEKRIWPDFSMRLIDTGKPETSTGECVASAAKYFLDKTMCANFNDVTLAMDKAYREFDLKALQECVRENHRLLVAIGVVPKKVQDLILSLEGKGLAAKICGAGATRGQNGGIVVVIGEE